MRITELPFDPAVAPTLWGRGKPYFNVADCQKLIECCKTDDIAILDAEGLEICGENIVPDMDYIADFLPIVLRVLTLLNKNHFNQVPEYQGATGFRQTEIKLPWGQ